MRELGQAQKARPDSPPVHRGVEALAGLAPQRQESGAVAVVQEDSLAPVAAAGGLVQRVRELDAQRAGHGGGPVVAVF